MTECTKCETCLYNKNCQFLAKHKNVDVEGCSAYKNAADVVEVVHSHWVMGVDEADYEYGVCANCGYVERDAFPCGRTPKYCSECGARMDGET